MDPSQNIGEGRDKSIFRATYPTMCTPFWIFIAKQEPTQQSQTNKEFSTAKKTNHQGIDYELINLNQDQR